METDTEVAPLVKYYEKIARHLQERPAVAEKEAATLLKRACAHAQHRDVDLSRTALTVLGVLLHRRAPPAELATEVSGWLLPLLHQLLRQPAVEARRPLVRALWCLEALVGAGHLPEERPEPLAQLVRTLLRAGMPSAVQIRAVTLVRRVAGSPAAGPTALVPLVRLLWPVLLRSTMPAVATEAEETVRACMAVAGVQAAFTGELLAMATSGGYLAQLQEAVTRPECGAQALTAWALLVDCLGARLQSTALINQVLQVIQAPFRSNNNELRRRSFVAWRSMVNNFLASGRLHENPKRLKLLITPLTQGNTGRPAVAVEKFRVWWTLLAGLGPHLSATFDTTTEPFLRFCFVPADKGLANGGGGGARDRVGGVVLQLADARPLARAALIQLLSPGCRQFAAESVAAREHEAVTGAVFARHAALLADSAAACLLRAPADGLAEVLLEPLLDWTTRHLESQASLGLTREQGLPVTAVLRALDTLLAAQLESPVAEQVVIVADRLVARLPERFVWSSLHQMEGAAGAGGPPALFLLRSLGRRPSGEPSGGAALSRLVRALGADALRRLPELVALLSGAELAEELRPLVWHDTAETLLEHIEKTQEVDSGDALGHDFGPVSALLAAPLSWPPSAAGPHLHTWSRLFCAARVAAELVATAPPNALAAEVAGRLRAAAPLAVPAAAHCLRVMAETALLKETDGAPRSGTGSPLKRRGPSPSDASAAVLEATVPQLAPLLLLLADLCSQLEEHATPEAVADLAESVRRLSGVHVAAAPATAALVQTLGAATASLLQVAAPNSPVRNKVLSAYEAVVGLVRQRLSELSPTAVLAQLAPLLEAAPAAEPSRRLWHAVLAPRRPAVPEHLAPLLARLAPPPEPEPAAAAAGSPAFKPRRRLMEALSAEKERRQRAAASPNKTAMSPGRPPPPAAPPSPARGGKDDTVTGLHQSAEGRRVPLIRLARLPCTSPLGGQPEFVVIPPSPAGPRPLTEHQREVRAAPRDSIPALYADLSQDTQQLAAAAAAPDDSQTGAELRTPAAPAGGAASLSASGSRSGARRRLLGTESQPEPGAVSFAGAVGGPPAAQSEELPRRAPRRGRPRRLRQSLPGPAGAAATGPAGAVATSGLNIHTEEAMDAPPTTVDDAASPAKTNGAASPKNTDSVASSCEVDPSPARKTDPAPLSKTEDATPPPSPPSGEATKTAVKVGDAAETGPDAADSDRPDVPPASKDAPAGEGDASPSPGDAPSPSEDAPSPSEDAEPPSGNAPTPSSNASPVGRRSRPRRTIKRSPQVAAFISSARRLLEADRRRRRRSEPAPSAPSGADEPTEAESAPAVLQAAPDTDGPSLALKRRRLSTSRSARSEEGSEPDSQASQQPKRGAAGRLAAAEARRARTRRRRTAVVTLSERRLMEESPPEPSRPPAAAVSTDTVRPEEEGSVEMDTQTPSEQCGAPPPEDDISTDRPADPTEEEPPVKVAASEDPGGAEPMVTEEQDAAETTMSDNQRVAAPAVSDENGASEPAKSDEQKAAPSSEETLEAEALAAQSNGPVTDGVTAAVGESASTVNESAPSADEDTHPVDEGALPEDEDPIPAAEDAPPMDESAPSDEPAAGAAAATAADTADITPSVATAGAPPESPLKAPAAPEVVVETQSERADRAVTPPPPAAAPVGGDPEPVDSVNVTESPQVAATESDRTAPAEPQVTVTDSNGPAAVEPPPEEHEGTPLKRAVVRLSRLSEPAVCSARRQLGLDEPATPSSKAAGDAAPAAGPPPPPAESEELFASPEPNGGLPPRRAAAPAPPPVATSRAARLVGLAQKRQAPPPDAAESPERERSPPALPPTPSTPVQRRPPWARHVYSPQASPSAGILKRRRLMGPPSVDSPPTPGKRRAVQFAEPPVSDSVEIPRAGRPPLRASRGRGRRGLRMEPSQDFEESPPAACGDSAGLCPALADCTDSVAELVDRLTSASWRTGLVRLLSARGVSTVGQLARLPPVQLADLPFRSPRVETVTAALSGYLAVRQQRTDAAGRTAPAPPPGDVEGPTPDAKEPTLDGEGPAPDSEGPTPDGKGPAPDGEGPTPDLGEPVPDVQQGPATCCASTQTCSPALVDVAAGPAAPVAVLAAVTQTPPPPELQSVAQQTAPPQLRSTGQQAEPPRREAATVTERPARRTAGVQTARPAGRHVHVQVGPATADASTACEVTSTQEGGTQTEGGLKELVVPLLRAASRAELLEIWVACLAE